MAPAPAPSMPPQPGYQKQEEGNGNTAMIVGMIAIAVVAVVIVALAGLYVMQNSNRQNTANSNNSNNSTNSEVAETSPTPVPPPPVRKEKNPPAQFTAPTFSEKPAPPAPKTESKSLADLIDVVEPAVVRLDVDEVGGGSVGSGFFVGETGVIVTNFHVVQGARRVTVTTNDGNKAIAQGFYYATPFKDLAVIQVNPDKINIKPLSLAPKVPRKGDDVAAFGSPLGFSFSTTQGIVSSIRTGDEIQKTLKTMSGEDIYKELGYAKSTNWLQTSAAISGGNSGGPLVNMQGELVGVNTWQTPLGQNLNFACTVDEVRSVLKQAEGQSLKSFSQLARTRIPSRVGPSPNGPIIRIPPELLPPGFPGIPSSPRIRPRSPRSPSRRSPFRGGLGSNQPSSSESLSPEELSGTETIAKVTGELFTKGKGNVAREFVTTSPVVDLALSADESMLAIACQDGQVMVFDFKAGGSLLYRIQSEGKLIRRVRFTATPMKLVTLRDQGSSDCFSFRNPETGEPDQRSAMHPGSEQASSLAVSKDGLSVFGGYKKQSACRFWRFEPGSNTGLPWRKMFGSTGRRVPSEAEISPNNQFLVTGFENGEVVVSTGTGRQMATYTEGRVHNGKVTGVAVNKDSNRMYTSGVDGRIAATGFKAKDWTVREFETTSSSPIYGLDLSQDDKWLAVARGDQSIELFNAKSRKRKKRVETQTQSTKVLLMTESQFGVTAEIDGVRIYKLQ